MMERKVRDSCGKSESRGDPAGAREPRRTRLRKASALRSNQRSNCTVCETGIILSLFGIQRLSRVAGTSIC
ncbi:hypothetical protein KEH51_28010 [[Brevibacterium] frigoritolerans]|uniref:Uncharacterized protein n=1 Tax=Peribacillus frigoritolerans TaxID=450367 RepID=A0A941FRH0_9BACI|nr:hypothetical protein [Peribacillus frigoritolerans]